MTPEGRRQTVGMGDAVRLTYTMALPPESYANTGQRAYTEESCRRKIVQHAANQGLVLVDGAAGRWEQVTQELEPGDPWTRWEYRLVGYGVPSADASTGASS